MSSHETPGTRDIELSRRHRAWGFDCPATDIDFLLIEYDRSAPKALIEYKYYYASPEEWHGSPSIKAVAILADNAGVPFFVVRYHRGKPGAPWWFRVYPRNDQAAFWCEEGQPFREDEYVEFLHRLRRGREVA